MRAYCIILTLSVSLVSNVLNAQQARYWVTLTDLTDAPLTSIDQNAEFVMSVYTQDLRDDPRGMFSAYVDVAYDADLAAPIGPIDHEDIYVAGVSGSTAQRGLLDEVGGLDGISGLGGGAFKVFSLRFASQQESGTLTFQTGPATDQVQHPTLLFGATSVLDPSEISFGTASLRIVPEPNSACLFTLGWAFFARLRQRRK